MGLYRKSSISSVSSPPAIAIGRLHGTQRSSNVRGSTTVLSFDNKASASASGYRGFVQARIVHLHQLSIDFDGIGDIDDIAKYVGDAGG